MPPGHGQGRAGGHTELATLPTQCCPPGLPLKARGVFPSPSVLTCAQLHNLGRALGPWSRFACTGGLRGGGLGASGLERPCHLAPSSPPSRLQTLGARSSGAECGTGRHGRLPPGPTPRPWPGLTPALGTALLGRLMPQRGRRPQGTPGRCSGFSPPSSSPINAGRTKDPARSASWPPLPLRKPGSAPPTSRPGLQLLSRWWDHRTPRPSGGSEHLGSYPQIDTCP